ncbi:MAG: hypothetical protein ACJ8MR_18550 [Povalibacter sp.]|jgi:hypothetical protein
MKTRIAVGATLLLTLGSAVAGSMLYGQGQERAKAVAPVTSAPSERVTPAMIDQWKQSSRSDYIAPRVPI